MTSMVNIRVGSPWPYPIKILNGMQAILEPGEAGPTLALVLSCEKPTSAEEKALKEGPLKLGIMTSPPLTWILLDAGCISFDAPYARGLTSLEHSRAISLVPNQVAAWPENTRSLVEVYVIDRQIVISARIVSLSRTWWETLASGIAQPPEQLDRSSYDRAVTEQQKRWTTAQMLARARIIEIGGRV